MITRCTAHGIPACVHSHCRAVANHRTAYTEEIPMATCKHRRSNCLDRACRSKARTSDTSTTGSTFDTYAYGTTDSGGTSSSDTGSSSGSYDSGSSSSSDCGGSY